MKEKSYILVTGVAGFIGSAISTKLLKIGAKIKNIFFITLFKIENFNFKDKITTASEANLS